MVSSRVQEQPLMKPILPLSLCASLALWMLLCTPAAALVVTGGAEPVRDAGWPVGALEMANLPTRFAWYEGPPFGGGDWHFQYRCNGTAQFNEALQTFSRILWPRLELIVVDGMGSVLGKPDEPVDWEFQVWVPASFYRLSKPRFFRPEPSLPPPRITAYVGKGSMVEWAKVQVPPNVTVIDKRVEYSPYKDSQGGVARITAYDMTNSKVIPGVDLVLKQYEDKKYVDKYAARTDDRGSVAIRNIAPGYYYITLRCPGYATRTVEPGYRNWDRTLGIYDVLLSPVASLSGTVTDLAGVPLAGVTVRTDDTGGLDGEAYYAEPSHGSQKTVTDADGRFAFDDLPRGSTRFIARKDGLSQITSILAEYEIPGKGPVQIKMDRSGTVRGKVTGAANLEPGQEIHVSIEPEEGPTIGKWGGGTRCQPDGSFEIRNVPPGRYTLTARLNPGTEGKHEATRDVELKPGETLEVELKIE